MRGPVVRGNSFVEDRKTGRPTPWKSGLSVFRSSTNALPAPGAVAKYRDCLLDSEARAHVLPLKLGQVELEVQRARGPEAAPPRRSCDDDHGHDPRSGTRCIRFSYSDSEKRDLSPGTNPIASGGGRRAASARAPREATEEDEPTGERT